ncbi:hypothetical protein TD95_003135 [Thielaviopsis punctulata]|uniref:N-acetyltransferase domain-containing protein n=1 Tax=Thielaviopsis punctulata TaxID=72032 RepID=A0A0F4Z9X0_9PEZI|nr:hypothetical protein TD95_003135 [Thielaviopsis punctulata]
MKLNKDTAVSTPQVLLVPYEPRHVPLYHEWMQDPAIQEATASEPLSLREEFENQESWRASADKLTFILCAPLSDAGAAVAAGTADAAPRMRGDINLFLTEAVLSDDDDEGFTAPGSGSCCAGGHAHAHCADEDRLFTAEIDVMVARAADQGQGLGTAAVRALLEYVRRHEAGIVREAAGGTGVGKIIAVEARIKEGNVRSRRVFARLGFVQRGGVNYFGEIKMVSDAGWRDVAVDGWREMEYTR